MSHQTNWKPKPHLLTKRELKADVRQIDREENAKVKARSGGACEVRTVVTYRGITTSVRCQRRADHVHHLVAGLGRRNVGRSITAKCKLHTCQQCHSEIHGRVLVPVDGTQKEDAATIRFERVK